MRKIFLYLFLLFFTYLSAEKILIVDSYHYDYPWSKQIRDIITDSLSQNHNLIVYELNTKRIHQTAIESKANECLQFFHEIKPDLVILMDDNSNKYLATSISETNTPIFFLGVNQNPRLYYQEHALPENVSGVIERPPYKRSAEIISSLIPLKYNRFLILMDNSITAKFLVSNQADNRNFISLFSIDMYCELAENYDDWKINVINAKENGYDAIILGSYAALKDITGNQIPLDESSRWTSMNSPVPVFAFFKFSIGKDKAIGGLIISAEIQAETLIKQVNMFLNNGTMPLIESPNDGKHVYSKSQLKRWNINLPSYIESEAMFVE
jgi:hypothetical protein